MRLKGSTYENIKYAVADMLKFYEITVVKFDVFELAKKMEITVVRYSELDEETKSKSMKFSKDGFSLSISDTEWIIYFNDKMCKERIRQTIMHEIGHYYLGHIINKDGSFNDEEESEATFFAKYSLTSPVLIKNLVEDKTEDNVMKIFGISREAARIALSNYLSRFKYGPDEYTDYEKILFNQFCLST